jgi:hypothetical protein
VSGVAALVWALLRAQGIEDAARVKSILLETASVSPYLTAIPPSSQFYFPNANWYPFEPVATGGQVNLWAAASAASGPFLSHNDSKGGMSTIDTSIAPITPFTFVDSFTNVGLKPADLSRLNFAAQCSDEHGNVSNYALALASGAPATLAPGATSSATFTLSSGFPAPPAGTPSMAYTCTYSIHSSDSNLSSANLVKDWSSHAPFHVYVGTPCTSNADCASAQYCRFTSNLNSCSAAGTCEPLISCGPSFVRVCGCDGTTYADPCAMAQNKVSLLHPGSCP